MKKITLFPCSAHKYCCFKLEICLPFVSQSKLRLATIKELKYSSDTTFFTLTSWTMDTRLSDVCMHLCVCLSAYPPKWTSCEYLKSVGHSQRRQPVKRTWLMANEGWTRSPGQTHSILWLYHMMDGRLSYSFPHMKLFKARSEWKRCCKTSIPTLSSFAFREHFTSTLSGTLQSIRHTKPPVFHSTHPNHAPTSPIDPAWSLI